MLTFVMFIQNKDIPLARVARNEFWMNLLPGFLFSQNIIYRSSPVHSNKRTESGKRTERPRQLRTGIRILEAFANTFAVGWSSLYGAKIIRIETVSRYRCGKEL